MRASGILMHITSLYDEFGCGTLGKPAFDFVDFLAKSKTGYWQMLPIGPTGYGDSPYQSYSAFAGNVNLIDLHDLIKKGLIEPDEPLLQTLKGNFNNYEEYGKIKTNVLRKAYDKYKKSDNQTDIFGVSLLHFFAYNRDWLEDYALFMTLKAETDGTPWPAWDKKYRLRDETALLDFTRENIDTIHYYYFEQMVFALQFDTLKQYAGQNGVKLIGDMPIYVSADSADIWGAPENFRLDAGLRPTYVAGCPPDDFAPTGQLWGNPLYNWELMKQNGYKWWIRRMEYSARFFDVLRIDHFRGFESFYAIPAADTTAENGTWEKGPGAEMFKFISAQMKKQSKPCPELIAENLGFLTPEVHEMLDELGYPGMNVMEFAFGGDDSGYLPHNFIKNSVSYIGTHDNDTALGWFLSSDTATQKRVKRYTHAKGKSPKKAVKALIRTLFMSASDLVVVAAQDYLKLGSSARMNTPSTVGTNWHWQAEADVFTDKLSRRIAKLNTTYFRTPVISTEPVAVEEKKETVAEIPAEKKAKKVMPLKLKK
ncbi:MAG: 4-alpha-glucanotransferase [Ruminococcus sp.]|jgi:4-alpha-glucanotransferase|nr:4-alpha-glucanotransferase [Ruminococcus sp.]